MQETRKVAKFSLNLILISGLLAWLIFVFADFSDALLNSSATTVYPSQYLIFAAIAIFALGSLAAKRRVLKMRATATEISRLARPVQEFASTVIIIALGVAVIAAFAGFMGSFFDYHETTAPVVRIFNAYLPIVLYTVLVISVLLVGFVFSRNPESVDESAAEYVAAPDSGAAPVADPQASSQKQVGLAFSLPIIAVAVALIFGLIVYDITRTSLESWIWVIIQALVATGIVFGTIYATRATGQQARATGAALGAQNLNFILSILFAIIVSFMAFAYGNSAVSQLTAHHDVSLSVYSDNPTSFNGEKEEIPLTGAHIFAHGSGMTPGTKASLSARPGDTVIADTQADSSGFFNFDAEFPVNLTEGEITLVVQATAPDGKTFKLELPVTVTADSLVFDSGSSTYQTAETVTIVNMNAAWVLKEFLPALLLLVIVLLTLRLTFTVRNRDF